MPRHRLIYTGWGEDSLVAGLLCRVAPAKSPTELCHTHTQVMVYCDVCSRATQARTLRQ
ncbi:uncharacterized protein B0I36DRAFT_338602 [Microdochium trichocladiopsis]|uniref:Uncharacterized protein n=1 Tax=Microdochium trichocladiopsis TaxID=1682393 RepID=A0A9P9BJ77_9PEZI|nr:uncharacterized protein B0I36DRAFT_338602 [Microdochium trichocladiopsis]KAH7014356.1 hypothetical protein B0I36DRAFT_338602 [Microdochium trichocladiopsis]